MGRKSFTDVHKEQLEKLSFTLRELNELLDKIRLDMWSLAVFLQNETDKLYHAHKGGICGMTNPEDSLFSEGFNLSSTEVNSGEN